MTRYFIAIIVFSILKITLRGQTFNGRTTDKGPGRNCVLIIDPDSSVVLVYSSKTNDYYAQYSGNLTRKKDSLFHVSVKMTFGTLAVMWQPTVDRQTLVVTDTNFFSLPSNIFDLFKPVRIMYAKGQSLDYLSPDKTIPLDQKTFNQTKGYNYYYVQTNAKDRFTNQKLTFKVNYGTSLSFIGGDSFGFDIVILKNKAWSVAIPSSGIENFIVTKK